ncbi:hypothetical protein [Levilactobacillus sp.]|nr:hypothetical protein [Levilactobacillus sp.]
MTFRKVDSARATILEIANALFDEHADLTQAPGFTNFRLNLQ